MELVNFIFNNKYDEAVIGLKVLEYVPAMQTYYNIGHK